MQLSEKHGEILSQHQKTLDDLKKMMQHGDWLVVCEKTGLSKPNAISAFTRVGSKHHLTVVKTIKEVINERLDELKNL